MRVVKPSEMDATYTQQAASQKLVDRALAKHPEVLLLAISAQPPGHRNVIVASNFGHIGKIEDEDDMRCIRTGKPNLEVNGPPLDMNLCFVISRAKSSARSALCLTTSPARTITHC